MTARVGFVLVLLLVPAAAACGAIGENLSVGSDNVRSDAGTPDGGEADGGEVATVLYESHFEGKDECAAWTAAGGVITTVPGQTGNACMLCATATQQTMYMRRDIANVPQVEAGLYNISFSSAVVVAHGVPGGGAAFSFDDENGMPIFASEVAPADGGANADAGTPPTSASSGTHSSSWEMRGITRNVIQTIPTTVLGIYLIGSGNSITPNGGGALQSGDCIAFDDLRVSYSKSDVFRP